MSVGCRIMAGVRKVMVVLLTTINGVCIGLYYKGYEVQTLDIRNILSITLLVHVIPRDLLFELIFELVTEYIYDIKVHH